MNTSQLRRFSFVLALGSLTLVGFQNCGKSFKDVGQEASNLSSQCKATISNSVAKFKALVSDSDCESPAAYSCEERVFSPDVRDFVEQRELCLDDPESNEKFCIPSERRLFDTSGSRSVAGIGPEEFEKGGEFHRSEFRCSQETQIRGVKVFEGQGADITVAFGEARRKCRKGIQP